MGLFTSVYVSVSCDDCGQVFEADCQFKTFLEWTCPQVRNGERLPEDERECCPPGFYDGCAMQLCGPCSMLAFKAGRLNPFSRWWVHVDDDHAVTAHLDADGPGEGW